MEPKYGPNQRYNNKASYVDNRSWKFRIPMSSGQARKILSTMFCCLMLVFAFSVVKSFTIALLRFCSLISFAFWSSCSLVSLFLNDCLLTICTWNWILRLRGLRTFRVNKWCLYRCEHKGQAGTQRSSVPWRRVSVRMLSSAKCPTNTKMFG